jgi:hypothetical protein
MIPPFNEAMKRLNDGWMDGWIEDKIKIDA